MSDTIPAVPTTTPPPKPITLPPQTAQAAVTAAEAGVAAVMNAAPGAEPTWAKPAVSILTLVIFTALVVVAWVNKDQTSFNLLCGAAIAMAQSVVGYYLGSSSGSAEKTALLAAAPPIKK